jgi:hypothetical protein
LDQKRFDDSMLDKRTKLETFTTGLSISTIDIQNLQNNIVGSAAPRETLDGNEGKSRKWEVLISR